MVSPTSDSVHSEQSDRDDQTSTQTGENRPIPKQQEPEPEHVGGIIGFRGLGIFNGFLNEEWLNELRTWHQEVRAYLEMRDDITISTLLSAVKLPLLGAEWRVSPSHEDNPADVEAAEFVEQNMERMEGQTWRSYVEQALEILDFGFAVNEILLKKRSDGRWWLQNLEPRGQETLRRWGVLTQEPDVATHMVQGPFRTGMPVGQISVPLWKCIHLVREGRKGNPQGKSFLRPIYMGYKFLKNLRVFEAIGIERDTAGIPVYTLPSAAGTLSDTQVQDIEKQLQGLKIDEAMFIVIPHDAKLEAFQSSSKSYNIRGTIEAYEKQILMRGFAQFLALGTTNVGTQSLIEGQADFFGMSLRAIQQTIVDQLNEQLVPYIFEWNKIEGMTGLPYIEWDPPNATDIKQVVEVLTSAISSTLITPTRADEEQLRARMGMTELADDEGNQPRGPQVVPGGGDDSRSPGFRRQLESEEQHWHAGTYIAEFDAGQDLRTIPGVYEKFTNQYQKDLVEIYDKWTKESVRLVSLQDMTPTQAQLTIERRLKELGVDLKLLGRQRISEASGLGLGEILGKRASSPEVVETVARLIKQNDEFVEESLLPSIRERFSKDVAKLTELPAAEREAFALDSFIKRRSAVARGAGGAQVAIFDAQMAAGIAENRERVAAGAKPIATRWVLDKTAEHCADDRKRGTFGCPSLAHSYPSGWSSMPTVPAGNVSCLGNCRCFVEADFDGDGTWKRIT